MKNYSRYVINHLGCQDLIINVRKTISELPAYFHRYNLFWEPFWTCNKYVSIKKV